MVFADICFVLTMLVLLLFFCIFFMFMLRDSGEDNDQLPERCVDLYWEIQRQAFEALWGEIRESFKEIREFLIHEVEDVSVFEDEAIFRVFVDVQREWKRCEEYFKTEDSQKYTCTEGSAEADRERFLEAAKMVDYFEDLVDQLTDMVIEKKRADEAGTAPNYVYKFEKGNIGGREKKEKKELTDSDCKREIVENDLVNNLNDNIIEQEIMTDGAGEENIGVTDVTEKTLDNFNLALNDVMEMLKSRLEEIRSSPSGAPLTDLEAELPNVFLKLLDSVHATLVPSSSFSLTSSSEISEALSFCIPSHTSSSKFAESLLLSPSLQIPSESSEAPQDSDHVNPAVNKSNYIDVESVEYSSEDDADWNIVTDARTH